MPHFPSSGWPMQPGPSVASADSLREFLDVLLPYRRSRQPVGLLSEGAWEEPRHEADGVPQRQLPGWITRPDLFPRPGVRNLVYDRDYDGPPRAPSPIGLAPAKVRGMELFRGPHQEKAVGYGRDTVLPDAVVNSFREPLDAAGLHFLKHGPRSTAEQLAFAQRVHPDAHRSASSAPETEQSRFQQGGTFDDGRHFVGPDRKLYLRSGDTEEPLAYRLRRGLENAVGGFGQPELPEIIAASFPETQGGAGTDQLERRRQAQNWPGAALAPEDTAAPLPPQIPEVKAISSKFRQIERDVREQGLTVGADALKHFMDGGGTPVQYDQAQFRAFPVVQEAEHGNQKHFADWMLGTHPKRAVIAGKTPGYVDSGLEQIKTDLLKMKDGDTLHRGSRWDAVLPYSKASLFLQATNQKDLTPDADLYGATGDAMLRSDGGFTFHRRGNRIEFKGAVEHNFDEPFEFELDNRLPFLAPAKDSTIPWLITQKDGVAMQDHGLGKPFRTSARWDQPVSGELTIDSKGALRLDHIEWGDARPRRTRHGM